MLVDATVIGQDGGVGDGGVRGSGLHAGPKILEYEAQEGR